MPTARKLSAAFPFRRVAVVLAGGGALGAYEVGVLRVLGRAGLRPAVLAGTSIGAINAAGWLAHGFDTAGLERVWGRVSPSAVGMRWTTLAVRAVGGLLVAVGLVQTLLILLGSPEITLSRRLWGDAAVGHGVASVVLDALAWATLAALGATAVALSRPAEDWLATLDRSDPSRLSRWLGWLLVAGAIIHLVTWGTGFPWPHGFSASLLLTTTLAWLVLRPGPGADRVRLLLMRLLPETQGRGLWRGTARRRLVEQLVGDGQPARLTGDSTLLVVTALAVDTGRIAHFVSGPDPAGFESRIVSGLGEVVRVRSPEEMIDAVVASSSIPLIFEPTVINGRTFVDAGQFSNQPLAAVQAADADAVVVVLLAPVEEPPRAEGEANLLALAGRLIEVANWRSLHEELRRIPREWAEPRPGGARVVVVVGPERPLPGGLFAYDPSLSARLIETGEQDAWRVLDQAGWLEPAPRP